MIELSLEEMGSDLLIENRVKQTDTIVIDNGSKHIRFGFYNKDGAELGFVCSNLVYRSKDRRSFHSFPQSQQKSMFEMGFPFYIEVLELTMDALFEKFRVDHLEHIIFTTPVLMPDASRRKIEYLFFEVYRMKTAYFGHDALFSYAHAFSTPSPRDVVIGLGNSCISVFVVENDCVMQKYRCNFSGFKCLALLHALVSLKIPLTFRQCEYLLTFLRVPLDFKREAIEAYDKAMGGNHFFKITQWTEDLPPPKKRKPFIAKRAKTEQVVEVAPTEVLAPEGEEEVVLESEVEMEAQMGAQPGAEDFDKVDAAEGEKKPSNFVYLGGLFRIRQRIVKSLGRVERIIELFKDEHERLNDFDQYKARLLYKIKVIRNDLRERNEIIRRISSSRTIECRVRYKVATGNSLTPEEELVYEQVKRAEDDEAAEELRKELDKLVDRVLAIDSDYDFLNVYEVLKGDRESVVSLNTELLRATEAIFDSSMYMSQELSLRDVIESLGPGKFTRVFVTGGLSQLEGMRVRLEAEFLKISTDGPIEVVMAKSPTLGGFLGANTTRFVEVITSEEYFEGLNSKL